MKRNTIIRLSIAFAAVGILVCFLCRKDKGPAVAAAPKDNVTRVVSSGSKANKDRPKVNRKKDFRGLLSKIARSQAEEDIPSNTQLPEEVDFKTLAKYTLMAQAIAPYFFDKASETFDELLHEQSYNRRWTELRENELRAQLKKEKFSGSAMKDIACYETMCKLTMVHESDTVLAAFSDEALSSGDVHGPTIYFGHPNEDGSYEAEMYIGRHGDSDTTIKNALIERMYENTTGQSADSVEPTPQQTEQLMAQLQEAWSADDRGADNL